MVKSNNKRIALRLDDVGASSKKYEIYSNKHLNLGGDFRLSANWLFLKYIPGLSAWGPYKELSADQWLRILELLELYNAKLTVGITATWVRSKKDLIPFPEKFPAQADIIRQAANEGKIEVANHGLTHCVLHKNVFRPKLFSGNRQFHREFWDWLPREVHMEHMTRSQGILQEWLGKTVVTLVPPGNVYSTATIEAARENGIRFISCETRPRKTMGIRILGNKETFPFHDRDIVRNGIDWLEGVLKKYQTYDFVQVNDLAELHIND